VALVSDEYDTLVRKVLELNARHALQPESADERLRALIVEWPDAWKAVHGRRRSASGLALAMFTHAPLSTCEFVLWELADAAFRRVRRAW
jgi:hypothetical protein